MTNRTSNNLCSAFVGEAKAYFRLEAFAQRAEEDELPEIAKLFRAVAQAERIHASRNLELLGDVVIRDTEDNLETSFAREEMAAEVYYPQFIREAEQEDHRRAAISFAQARDVEEMHAALYKRALQHLLSDIAPAYWVCNICGYISEGEVPERCPICGASPARFNEVL